MPPDTPAPAEAVVYPEHEKLADVRFMSQAVGEFIEWLEGQDLAICEWIPNWRGGDWVRSRMNRDQLLAKHFGIDLDELEAEKRDMLAQFARATP